MLWPLSKHVLEAPMESALDPLDARARPISHWKSLVAMPMSIQAKTEGNILGFKRLFQERDVGTYCWKLSFSSICKSLCRNHDWPTIEHTSFSLSQRLTRLGKGEHSWIPWTSHVDSQIHRWKHPGATSKHTLQSHRHPRKSRRWSHVYRKWPGRTLSQGFNTAINIGVMFLIHLAIGHLPSLWFGRHRNT